METIQKQYRNLNITPAANQSEMTGKSRKLFKVGGFVMGGFNLEPNFLFEGQAFRASDARLQQGAHIFHIFLLLVGSTTHLREQAYFC